jgi:hypothetical protein
MYWRSPTKSSKEPNGGGAPFLKPRPCKLLKRWRDGRVAEGARLESEPTAHERHPCKINNLHVNILLANGHGLG